MNTSGERTVEAVDAPSDGHGAGLRVYLIIAGEPERRSRVVELAVGQEVTFGRSRTATIAVEHERVSRMHARIWRDVHGVWAEDLGSRNGTRVRGERLAGPVQLGQGDEVSIGPISAVLGWASRVDVRPIRVADVDDVEERLAAELDRAGRYGRPVALLALRVAGDDAAALIGRRARRMDLVGEFGGDDLLVVAPELGRVEATREAERLIAGVTGARVGVAIAPDDGVTPERLIARARAELAGEPAAPPSPSAVVGVVVDPAMQRLYQVIDRVADSAMTVLVLGETGVGKEVIAAAIHARSPRRDRPFVRLNSASIPAALIESELFGHERGAFTGADRRKIGYLEAASGGTLLLDEIADLPGSAQAKLLRVLEQKSVMRVGSTDEIAVDVRIIAATNVDLEAEARAGRFREDLYFRIAQFTLVVPPLRERRDEIVALAEHFLDGFVGIGMGARRLTDEVRVALVAYDWPGNVRELRNAMERAAVLAADGPITVAELSDKIVDAGRRRGALPAGVKGQLADFERQAIVAALEAEGGNQSRAARRLGLSRRGFIYKLEKHGLKAPPPSADQRRPPGGGL